MANILEKAKKIEDYIIALRREFHEYPELSGQEYKTQERIMRELDKLGIPYQKAGNTSLIATLKGGKEGKTIALRGDIDALPIKEETDIPFKSKVPGLMHACGHDAHTAMLIGAARILAEMKEEIPGEVRFFFQEGEETFSGAKKIIEAGGMKGVDACFGLHGMSELETGTVNVEPGYRIAGCDTIFVNFEGISGHGSVPHLAKDTIHPACIFVADLQGILNKKINSQEPIVLSVGKFHGGTKANVVAKFTNLEISMRYFNPEVREIAHAAIKRYAEAIAHAYEIKVEVIIEESALSLYNDDELAAIAAQSCNKVFGEGKNISLPRYMGSEDMPYYFQHAPGVYAFLGYRNEGEESIYFPHHEKFKLDEAYLKYGTALHVQFALDYLSSKS